MRARTYEEQMTRLHSLPGPWADEPDRLEWRSRGFACLMVRNNMGAWCGYVGVPEGHPWFGVKDVDADVHGGITFSGPCQEGGRICHVPLPGEPEVFWQGFDCNHAWDLAPLTAEDLRELGMPWTRPDEVYRDVEYVKRQVEGLAEQAEDAGNSTEAANPE